MQTEGLRKVVWNHYQIWKKILQGNRQDPMESYKILQELYGILSSSGNDPTVLYRSYEILQDPTVT